MEGNVQKKNSWLRWLQKIIFKPFEFISGIALAISLTYSITNTIMLKIDIIQIVLISIALFALLTIVFMSRKATKIAFVGVLLSILCAALIIIAKSEFQTALKVLRDFFVWVYYYSFIWETTSNNIYVFSVIYGVLLCIFFSILAWLFCYKRVNTIAVLIIGFTINGLLFYQNTNALNPFVFYMFIFSSILTYFTEIYYKRNINNDQQAMIRRGLFNLCVIPVTIIILIFTSLSPVSPLPIQWEWMDKKINTVYNRFYDKFHNYKYEVFSISQTGFGENSKLGGKVKADNRVVLTLESDNLFYLRGKVSNYYNGYQWLLQYDIQDDNSKNDMKISMEIESIEKQYRADINNYLNSGSIVARDELETVGKVNYTRLKTGSLFLPLESITINSIEPDVVFYTDINGIYSSMDHKAEKYKYGFTAQKLDFSEKVINLINQSRSGYYNDLMLGYIESELSNKASNTDPIVQERNYSQTKIQRGILSSILLKERKNINDFVIYTKFIHDNYTKIYPDLPDRVKQLALSITQDKQSQYDKVKAIEQYLSNSDFKYTLEPAETPSNNDFVDYFLFDTKEGYCTYFATSMCVMLQSIGIPARYIEGFVPSIENRDENIYYITNKNAHAWVEAYFEGYGWVDFEPTPVYRSTMALAKYKTEESYSSAFFDIPEEYQKYMEQYEMLNNSNMTNYAVLKGSSKQKMSMLMKVVIALCIIITLLLGILIFVFIKQLLIRFKYKKYNKLDTNTAILLYYSFFIRVLGRIGYKYEAGEMPTEYGKRIEESFYFNRNSFKNVTDIFMKAKYSNKSVTEEDKRVFMSFYYEFLYQIKRDIGRIKYYIYI